MNAPTKTFLSSLKRLRRQGFEPIGYEGSLNNPERLVYRLEYRGHTLGRHPIVLIAENGHVTYWDRDYLLKTSSKKLGGYNGERIARDGRPHMIHYTSTH